MKDLGWHFHATLGENEVEWLLPNLANVCYVGLMILAIFGVGNSRDLESAVKVQGFQSTWCLGLKTSAYMGQNLSRYQIQS